MRCFVTGCAGFIGSHLVDRLLAEGHTVVGYDNFSTGLEEFLTEARKWDRFALVRSDVLDAEALDDAIAGTDFVFHLAANADVRFGTQQPRRDFEQNAMATFNVLEAMRRHRIRRLVFASTGSVYGEADVFPTPERAPFPTQTSLYGASKLAGEGFISAYCEGFDFQAWIFRFVSILGERYTHGHVADFYRQLVANPEELYVLGDGHQRKSYLHIDDCIEAMLCAIRRSEEKVNIFNLGTNDYCEVNDSIRWITAHLGLSPVVRYSGGLRGWVGDNPFIFLDCSKMRNLGWEPKRGIKDAIIRTLVFLQENRWLLERRA